MKTIIIGMIVIIFVVCAIPVLAQDNAEYGIKLIDIAFDWENARPEEGRPVRYEKPSEEWRLYEEYRTLDYSQIDPVWSPDSKWIAFTDSDYAVWIVSPEGGDPVQVYDNFRIEYDGLYLNPIRYMNVYGFTPDSREVLFGMYIIDEDRGTEVEILDDRHSIRGVIPIIMAVNIETGKTRVIVEEAVKGRMSQNGRYLAYVNQDHRFYTDPDNAEHYNCLALYDTVSGETRYLTDTTTDGGYIIDNYCFTGDNSSIIAVMLPFFPVTKLQLFRIPLEGGEPELLVDEHEIYAHSVISPYGQYIMYNNVVDLTDQLHVYDTVTGETSRVFNDLEAIIFGLAWSPDGTKIAYSVGIEGRRYTDGGSGYSGFHIYVTDFDFSDLEKSTGVENRLPMSFVLNGNYPNPFNPSTTIEFSLPESGIVNLSVYNTAGQKIRELVSEKMSPGLHSIVWDGCDDSGTPVSSGVFISRLRMGDSVVSHRMMLVK